MTIPETLALYSFILIPLWFVWWVWPRQRKRTQRQPKVWRPKCSS